MITQGDITPNVGLIAAIKNESWDVRGAISELIDNSFGEARGDAGHAVIHWYPKTRELWVLDDGRGMKHVLDLYKLGQTAGRSVRDIGKYGWGGTRAIVWLADQVQVTTLRAGKVQSASVMWSEVKDWSIPFSDWTSASAMNTPTELLDRGHGTVIILKISRSRRFMVDVVQRELVRRYAPALRNGRQIFWKTGDGKRTSLTSSQEVHGTPISFYVRSPDGTELSVTGSAGYYSDRSVEESAIAICYGPRVITNTVDCFADPDGERQYGSCGVVGWVDLGEGWQDYLTSTKTDFCDDDIRAELMIGLFRELRTLLEEASRQARQIQIEALSVGLGDALGQALEAEISAPPFPDTTDWNKERDIPVKAGQRRDVINKQEEKEQKRPSKPSITVELVPARQVGHCMCEPKIQVQAGHVSIVVYLNEEDPYVIDAFPRKRPLQVHMFALIVIPEVIRAIMRQPEAIQKLVIPSPLLRDLQGRGEDQQTPWLTGHILSEMYLAVADRRVA